MTAATELTSSDQRRRDIALTLLHEARPSRQIDGLIGITAARMAARPLEVAAVFWEMVRVGYLDRYGQVIPRG